MINLLPPDKKKQLLAEERRKITVIIWWLVFFFLGCLILILLPIKFYLAGELVNQKALLSENRAGREQSRLKKLEEKFNSVNDVLKKLDSFYSQKNYFSEILENISRVLPKDALLDSVSIAYSAVGSGGLEVSLSGFIPSRESLFNFKKDLEEDSAFKDVSFPPSNWVSPVNINFFVSFKIPS